MATINEDLSPTEAAKALDLASLPVGTYVAWITKRGFGGWGRERGTIVAVTKDNYVVSTLTGATRARIPNTIEGRSERHLRPIRTPAEHQAIIDEILAQNAAAEAERQRHRAEKIAATRLRDCRQRATELLIGKHKDEYEALIAELVAYDEAEDAAESQITATVTFGQVHPPTVADHG